MAVPAHTSSAAAPRAPSANFGSKPSGSSSKDNRRLVFPGEQANPSDYSYYVDVIMTSFQCGGTLIAPNVVLTAVVDSVCVLDRFCNIVVKKVNQRTNNLQCRSSPAAQA